MVVIFGLGLLWKRSSGPAAVVAAIGTFFFSILFKFIMPETPFLLRMGYVFMVLVVLFIGISIFCNKKNEVAAAEMDGQTVEMQRTWSNILLGVGAICLILGIVQLIAKIDILEGEIKKKIIYGDNEKSLNKIYQEMYKNALKSMYFNEPTYEIENENRRTR